MAEAPRPSLIPAIFYKDPRAAIAWLEKALGFERVMLIEDDQGAVVHAELRFGNAAIMLGGEWNERCQSPRSLDGKNSQTVHIHIEDDVGAHFARAKAAGAEIVSEPTMQFYGDMTYSCLDPEGHSWTVGQAVKAVSREEAEAASGLKITGWV